MAKIEPRILKGFRDYSSSQQAARQDMFQTIQTVFERFGFLPLSTPTLEYKEILTGKYGEEEKLMYTFKDKGDRDVAMRYDLTVPLARYVAQNQNQLTFPFKRYQIAPVWRADNPQRGRSREFYQCDVDVVGTQSPLADAEVMACMCNALEGLGIKDYELRVNDRKTLQDFSVETIRAIDKIDKLGVEGVMKLLGEQGASKEETTKVKQLLEISQRAAPTKSIKTLMDLVADLGVAADKVKYAPAIARGLDYYTGTVFEIVFSDRPEFGSIVGGGRYDSLVDQFSDKSLPAVGGSIGIDRLFEALEEQGLLKNEGIIKVLVLNLDESLQNDYLQLATQIRQNGINCELYYETTKLDKQFKYAESKGIAYAVIMGNEEKQKGIVQVKNLQTREQKEVKAGELVRYLSS